MAIYKKSVSINGSWVKSSEITAKKAKIVSETEASPSSFLNKDGSPKTQDVCKVLIQGNSEPLNLSLNKATINGLVEAFGEDSKNWMNRVLSVETEKVKVAGKTVTALYLIPDGFKKIDDVNGYTVIVKNDLSMPTQNGFDEPMPEELPSIQQDDGEIDVSTIPF